MRMIICADKRGVSDWLNSYDYPMYMTDEFLMEYANILEVWVRDDLAGYIWFIFEDEVTVSMHMCMRKEYNNLHCWDFDAVGDYHKFAELLGAEKIVVNDAPHLHRLLLSLGYDKVDGFPCRLEINLPNRWSKYGRHQKNILTEKTKSTRVRASTSGTTSSASTNTRPNAKRRRAAGSQ